MDDTPSCTSAHASDLVLSRSHPQTHEPFQSLCVAKSYLHMSAFAGAMDALNARLCNGPVCSVRVYDRATAGVVAFTGTRLEGSKKAKDSLVMIWDDDEEYQAGRVQAFLSHSAPGSTSRDISDETSIAWIHWYKRVPDDQPTVDPDLQCPVFSRALNANEALGNFCLVDRILPCKLASPTTSSIERK